MISHATRTIQRAWRSVFRFRKLRVLSKLFHHTHGCNVHNVQLMGPSATAEFVRDNKRAAAAFKLIRRISAIASIRHQPAHLPPNITPKKLMSAYLIAVYPSSTFAEMYPLEQMLLDAATAFIKQIDRITAAAANSPTFCTSDLARELTTPFNAQLADYAQIFDKWINYDSTKLVNRISNSLFSLYGFIKNTPAEPHYKPMIEDAKKEIMDLRKKMVSVKGNDAMRTFNAALLATTPEELASCAGAEPSIEMKTPPNEYIVHELLIDPSYRYTMTGSTAVHERDITKNVAFHNLYWHMLKKDLSATPPNFDRAADLFLSIRDAVITASPGIIHDSLLKGLKINAVIKHIQLKSMDINTMVSHIVAVYDTMDASFEIPSTKRANAAIVVQHTFGFSMPETPEEDLELIRRWEKFRSHVNTHLIDGLRILYELSRGIRVRYINKRIANLENIILEQGYDYEKGKFKLNAVALDKTRAWLAREIKEMPPAVRNAPLPLVHAHAFLSLFANDKFVQDRVPETLRLDTSRLAYLHAELHALIKTRLLVIVAAETNTPTVFASIRAMRPGVFPQIATLNLPPNTVEHFEHTSRPRQITHSRTHAMLVAYLADQAAPVERFIGATPRLPADVVDAINTRFANLVALARRTAEISLSVHGKRYAELLAAV